MFFSSTFFLKSSSNLVKDEMIKNIILSLSLIKNNEKTHCCESKWLDYRLTTLKFGMIQKSETKMHPLKSLQKTNKKSVEDTKPWKDGVLKSWVAIMLCSFEFVAEKKLPAGDFFMIWKSWKSLKIHFSTVFPLEIAKKNPPAASKNSPKIFL